METRESDQHARGYPLVAGLDRLAPKLQPSMPPEPENVNLIAGEAGIDDLAAQCVVHTHRRMSLAGLDDGAV